MDAAVLRVGDVVCVRQGDTVPCDGVLLAAPSSRQHLFDAAMLTGLPPSLPPSLSFSLSSLSFFSLSLSLSLSRARARFDASMLTGETRIH